MRKYNKEYRNKISWITFIGYKEGKKVFCVDYTDGTSEDMFEEETEKFYDK